MTRASDRMPRGSRCFRGFRMDEPNESRRRAQSEPTQTQTDDDAQDVLTRSGAARRRFLFESGVLTTGLAAAPYLDAEVEATAPCAPDGTSASRSITHAKLSVNGR